MDLELIDWLNTYTFVEEAKYKDLEYAPFKFFIMGFEVQLRKCFMREYIHLALTKTSPFRNLK